MLHKKGNIITVEYLSEVNNIYSDISKCQLTIRSPAVIELCENEKRGQVKRSQRARTDISRKNGISILLRNTDIIFFLKLKRIESV